MGKNRKAKDQKRAAKYVEGIVSGLAPRAAANIAGYSDKTDLRQIERPGSPVSRIIQALEDKGINDDYLAREYSEGIELAKKPGAKDRDLNAHSKYLLQLGYLKGYGRNPQVAVQINNNTRGDTPDDNGRIGDTLSEIGELLKVVREELGARKAPGVSGEGDPVAGGDQLPPQVEPHP